MCTPRPPFFKLLAGLFAVAIYMLFLRAVSLPPASSSWEMLTPSLPTSISTRDAHMNTVYYVLRQTHEPLLRKDDGQNYTSKILKDWRHDLRYLQYSFCPDTGLEFKKGYPFTGEFFRAHIYGVAQKFDKGFAFKRDGGCYTVSFSTPQKGFLDYLTSYENAPTLKDSADYEIGLGAFIVESMSKEKIVLSRKCPISNGYSKVVIRLYRGPGDPQLLDNKISDFNIIPPEDVPEWVKANYSSFDNVELKSRILIINHPDADVRRLIRNCLDVDKFRRAYMPSQVNFYDIQTIIPMGVAEARQGLPSQHCERRLFAVHPSTPILYLNNREDNLGQILGIAKDFKNKTGIDFNVVRYPREKMAEIKLMRPRPYNLIVLVTTAIMANYEAFWGPFVDPSGYHDFNWAALNDLYKKLSRTEDKTERININSKMLNELEKQNAALALYQVTGKLYYPKGIKNIEVGRGFLQYPEVADFRW